jgi:flagellum-specific ATP synthase
VTDASHRAKAGTVRGWMAAIRDTEDLVSVGAYVPGANPKVDEARARADAIEGFLCQPSDTLCGFADATTALQGL